jgi:hypothetical protein
MLSGPFLAVTMYPERFTCSLLMSAGRSALYSLRAHATYPCDGELHNLMVFNPTYIAQCIQQFVVASGVKIASMAVALRGPIVHEIITYAANKNPVITEFEVPQGVHWQWYKQHIYAATPQKHLMYVAGMPRPITLQYHLMMHTLDMPLRRITTQRMSLLSLYKKLYGTVFRPVQLAERLAVYHYEVEKLFTPDVLGRVLHIPPHLEIDREAELVPLLNAYALVTSE